MSPGDVVWVAADSDPKNPSTIGMRPKLEQAYPLSRQCVPEIAGRAHFHVGA